MVIRGKRSASGAGTRRRKNDNSGVAGEEGQAGDSGAERTVEGGGKTAASGERLKKVGTAAELCRRKVGERRQGWVKGRGGGSKRGVATGKGGLWGISPWEAESVAGCVERAEDTVLAGCPPIFYKIGHFYGF